MISSLLYDIIPWHLEYHILYYNMIPFLRILRQRSAACVRDWRNAVEHLVEIVRLNTTYHGLQFTDIRVNRRGVRVHRTRDFKRYYSNFIPPTSQRDCPTVSRHPRAVRSGLPPRSYRAHSGRQLPHGHHRGPALVAERLAEYGWSSHVWHLEWNRTPLLFTHVIYR